MRIELVRWVDSVRHPQGWQSVDAYRETIGEETLAHLTTGWVIFEDERSMAIASSRSERDEEPTCTEVIQIPKRCILVRTALEVPA